MLGESVGTISVTATGYITTHKNNTTGVTTNEPTRIFHIHLISGTTASNLLISNGQTGSTWVNITGTSNKGIDFDFGMWGISIPNGAYITADANLISAQVTCKADKF